MAAGMKVKVKPKLASKTLWLSIAWIIAGALEQLAGLLESAGISAGWVAMAAGAIFGALRLVTGTPLKGTPADETKDDPPPMPSELNAPTSENLRMTAEKKKTP